jgi:hypothetical protein
MTCAHTHTHMHTHHLECNGAVEVRNRMIKKRMAAITAEIGRHAMDNWTAVATAAVRTLNNSPTARGGLYSAPSLLAEGELDPRDYLLPEDVGTEAGQHALPDVTRDSQFLVEVCVTLGNSLCERVCVHVCEMCMLVVVIL